MQEGAPKKRSSAVEAAALAVGILAAHPEAQALEIPPFTPWHVGIQDNFQQAVQRDKVEYFTIYARFADGSGEWTPPIKGTPISVELNSYENVADVMGQRRRRQLDGVCYIHTHQAEYLRKINRAAASKAYAPPSPQDIIGHAPATIQTYKSLNLDPNLLRFAVADNHGLWYFSSGNLQNATVEGSQKQQITIYDTVSGREMAREGSNFTTNSMQANFSFKTEYTKLRQAYKKNLNADVRFVPYGNIVNEPACAGVNYRP